MEGLDHAEMAQEAKKKGNALFAKKTDEAYKEALVAYDEAIALDGTNHVFYANKSAVYAAIAEKVYQPKEKVDNWVRALQEAKACTERAPDWAKGFLRQSQAEFEVLAAVTAWEERKAQDLKYKKPKTKKKKTAAAAPAADDATVEGAEDDAVEVEGVVETEADASEAKVVVEEEDEEEEVEEEEEEVLTAEQAEVVATCSFAECESSCRKGLALDAGSAPLRERLQSLRDAGHNTDEAADRALADSEAGDALKKTGNPLFSSKKFRDAATVYTRALAQDPFNHVLYSNRSACYAEDDELEKALADSLKCIALKPEFAKGFSRKSLALYYLGRYVEAEEAATTGLEVDGSNAALKDLLSKAKLETSESVEFQKQIHVLRKQKRQDAKMQEMIKGLNMGGNMQMFNGMNGMGDLSNLFGGGGGGGGGMGGAFGGSGMSEAQMRQTARALSQAGTTSGAAAN